jgi:hypothetical protein
MTTTRVQCDMLTYVVYGLRDYALRRSPLVAPLLHLLRILVWRLSALNCLLSSSSSLDLYTHLARSFRVRI